MAEPTSSHQPTVLHEDSLELPELPESVWKHVLQYLSLKDRLGSCTVCMTVYRAALTATDSIAWAVPEHKPYLQASFMGWLSKAQHQVTSLQLANFRQPPLQDFCCPGLQQLLLQQCTVQLAGQQGMLQGLQHLTHLSLQFCMLAGSFDSLTSIQALPDLQHLVVGALLDSQQQGVRQLSAEDMLPKLRKLTHLEVAKRLVLTAASIQHLSCLADLRTLILHFRGNSDVSTAALQALQHCQLLQRLDLSQPGTPINPSTAPFLSRASALQQLKLAHGALAPSALAVLTQLQQLDLNHVELLPDAAALLALLPMLQQLQHLRLGFLQCQWPAVSTAYSALAAGSKLHHLELSGCQMPAGAWQYVFPAGRQLPQLTSLQLGQVLKGARVQPAMEAADVASMAGCCPRLQELQLWKQLQPDAGLQSLQQLSMLTRVWLTDVGEGVLSSLAGLTQLHDMYVLLRAEAAAGQLQQLTALSQLTRLMIHVHGQPGSVSLSNMAPHGAAPDVWLQLHQLQAGQSQP